MSTDRDSSTSRSFSERCAEARAHLRFEMARRGLHEKDGWTIAQSTRASRGGSEIVLRPIHRQLEAPQDLECVVWVGEEDGSVESSCP